jgi:hypothetical protein
MLCVKSTRDREAAVGSQKKLIDVQDGLGGGPGAGAALSLQFFPDFGGVGRNAWSQMTTHVLAQQLRDTPSRPPRTNRNYHVQARMAKKSTW